jgi:thymidine kinase
MVRDGDTVVVGNTDTDTDADADVRYVVLCRRHHRAGQPYSPAPAVTLVG